MRALAGVRVGRVAQGGQVGVQPLDLVVLVELLDRVCERPLEGFVSTLSVPWVNIEVTSEKEIVSIRFFQKRHQLSCLVLPIPVVVVVGGQRGHVDVHRLSLERLHPHSAKTSSEEVLVIPEQISRHGESSEVDLDDGEPGHDGKSGAKLRGDDAVTRWKREVSYRCHVPALRNTLLDLLMIGTHPEVGQHDDVPVGSLRQISNRSDPEFFVLRSKGARASPHHEGEELEACFLLSRASHRQRLGFVFTMGGV